MLIFFSPCAVRSNCRKSRCSKARVQHLGSRVSIILREHVLRSSNSRDIQEKGGRTTEKTYLEVVAKGGDVLARVFADEQHLPHVRLGLSVAFEAVFVAGLLFLSTL